MENVPQFDQPNEKVESIEKNSKAKSGILRKAALAGALLAGAAGVYKAGEIAFEKEEAKQEFLDVNTPGNFKKLKEDGLITVTPRFNVGTKTLDSVYVYIRKNDTRTKDIDPMLFIKAEYSNENWHYVGRTDMDMSLDAVHQFDREKHIGERIQDVKKNLGL